MALGGGKIENQPGLLGKSVHIVLHIHLHRHAVSGERWRKARRVGNGHHDGIHKESGRRNLQLAGYAYKNIHRNTAILLKIEGGRRDIQLGEISIADALREVVVRYASPEPRNN